MTDKKNRFKQFIFGKTVVSSHPVSGDELEKLLVRGKKIKENGSHPSQDQIMDILSGVSKAWADPGYAKRREALKMLTESTGLGTELVEAILNEFPGRIDPDNLEKKLAGELGSPSIQDGLVTQDTTHARLTVQPVGQILHVAAGNAFLGCIESLIDGIITKNVNFLKMSTDRDFPVLFAESIRQFDKKGIIADRLAILWWQGGDRTIENMFKHYMDRIIFWGGDDALSSWKKDLGQSTVLVQHGPKISFGVLSNAGLKAVKLSELTDRIVFDIVIWEQKACNCPQMLFVEESVPPEEMKRFIDSLADSFEKANDRFPPGKRLDDEYVEILRTRELALAEHLATGQSTSVIGPETFDWTIIYEEDPKGRKFITSPLNRSIFIERYPSLRVLSDLLRDHSFYLQTVGYCLEDREISEYGIALSRLGVTRLCPFGVMAITTPGTPHDGSYALRDLTRVTVIE